MKGHHSLLKTFRERMFLILALRTNKGNNLIIFLFLAENLYKNCTINALSVLCYLPLDYEVQ